MSVERIYLDYASTAPLRPDVAEAMVAVSRDAGNASSLHYEGRRARAVLDQARERVATVLGASAKEIVFTSGGSEADTLAIVGVARARRDRGRHIVSTVVEHHAVLHALDALAADGFEITLLPVDAEGRVDERAFGDALRDDTILASVIYANNEIGTIAPIQSLAAAAHRRGVTFHTDAIAAPHYLALDVEALGVDLLSLSAHKFGGPAGVGALYVAAGTPLAPQIFGGPQQYGRRAGTENIAGIAGMALALERASDDRQTRAERVGRLRDRLEATLVATIPQVRINASGAKRLPNISSMAFAGADVEQLLVALDLAGVAVSAGSACTSGSLEPSHVIAALGDARAARETLRFSLGESSTAEGIYRVVTLLPGLVAKARGGVITPAHESAANGE